MSPPAKQDKGNHGISLLEGQSCESQKQKQKQKQLMSVAILLSSGQTGRDGNGVCCGQVMAHCQTQPSPTWSPAQKMSSGRPNRSPKTSRSSSEQPRRASMTGVGWSCVSGLPVLAGATRVSRAGGFVVFLLLLSCYKVICRVLWTAASLGSGQDAPSQLAGDASGHWAPKILQDRVPRQRCKCGREHSGQHFLSTEGER